jgi:hypothetical protein
VENFISPELPPQRKEALAMSAAVSGTLHVGALLIRRAAFDRIGLFEPRWRQGEFVEWWARAQHAGLRHAALADLVLHRRLHDDNLTQRERADRTEYARMLHSVLASRRSRLTPVGDEA